MIFDKDNSNLIFLADKLRKILLAYKYNRWQLLLYKFVVYIKFNCFCSLFYIKRSWNIQEQIEDTNANYTMIVVVVVVVSSSR